MIYVINDCIVYNTDDCTLLHRPTEDIVKLSITSGRLLEIILRSAGEVLTRESLLSDAWDSYGLHGSQNNLNQYISILRRAFTNFGCSGIIVTIPKIGFRLNSDISITFDENTPPIKEIVALSVRKQRKSKRYWLASISSLILPAALYLSLFVLDIPNRLTSKSISPVILNGQGGCEIAFLENVGSARQNFLLSELNELMIYYKMQCVTGTRIYFVNYTSHSTSNLGRTLAAFCKINDHGNATSCDNIYFREWRTQ